jgi:uncharacterized membrane protein
MAPLIVQLVATVIARIRFPWRDAARIGMAVLLLFTAVAHFTSIGYDMARMIPPPFTGAMWIVYLTGVLEALGAIGLLTKRYRRPAAICLVLLLLAMFPANVYAAIAGVQLRGKPASALWWRTPLQFFWIATLWWSAIARERDALASNPAR